MAPVDEMCHRVPRVGIFQSVVDLLAAIWAPLRAHEAGRAEPQRVLAGGVLQGEGWVAALIGVGNAADRRTCLRYWCICESWRRNTYGGTHMENDLTLI